MNNASFSEVETRSEHWLTRVDARAKIIVALGTLLLVLYSTKPLFPFCVLAACVTATIALRVSVRLIALRLSAPLALSAMLATMQSVLNSTPFAHSLFIALRTLAAVSIVLLLSSATPAHKIFHAMRAMNVPRDWVEIALLMYRYTFTFFDLAGDIVAAQRLRLGYSRVRSGLSSLGIAAATVLVRSVDQAERTHEAMLMRGYDGEIPFAPLQSMLRRDWALTGCSIFVVACLFCALEVYWR